VIESAGADQTDLAIVIVSHECREHLLTCLADLDSARSTLALEAFVVDNASTDGTADAVRGRFPWVECEALDENVGFARANNRALARVRADLIVLLNPDTRVSSAALAACVRELRRRPDVGILGPRVIDGDGSFDRRCTRGFPTLWSVACHVAGVEAALHDPWSGRYTQRWLAHNLPADVEAISGAVMICRTAAIRAVGGLDERFFMYGEDIDLCLRVRRAGWRVVYWPGAEITHLGGGSGTNPRSRAAWAAAIGDLHRIHRPGFRGRGAGLACDIVGTILSWIRSRRDERKGSTDTLSA
jgi:hypothetical protein